MEKFSVISWAVPKMYFIVYSLILFNKESVQLGGGAYSSGNSKRLYQYL